MMLREAGETLPGLADLSLRRGETSCQRGERRRGRRLDQAELNFPPVLKCIFFSFLNATLPFGGAGQQVRGLVRSDCASFSLEYERPFDLFVVCWMFFFPFNFHVPSFRYQSLLFLVYPRSFGPMC